MDALRPVTVITGASAGIGAALARVFARNGHALVLIARRHDKLDTLAQEIVASGGPAPFVLPMDLAEHGAAARLGAALAAQGLEPQFIVNNAGFGLFGPASEADRATLLRMIDVNVRTLTDLSLSFVDSLARHGGGVLNVASVAAFLPGPGMAVYYATKAYVLSFSEALHRELKRKNVTVTTLCPGPVVTEFQERAGVSSAQFPKILLQTPEQVAQAGYRGLMRGKRIVVPGLSNWIVSVLPRFVPRRIVLSASDMRQSRRLPARKS